MGQSLRREYISTELYCSKQSDGKMTCMVDKFPFKSSGSITMFYDCADMMQCSSQNGGKCLILEAEMLGDVSIESSSCRAYTVCNDCLLRVKFDCSNLLSGKCSKYDGCKNHCEPNVCTGQGCYGN